MCEAMTLSTAASLASAAVAAAGTGAGIYMQTQQASQAADAERNRQTQQVAAMAAERSRQSEIERRTNAMWNASLQDAGADSFEDAAGNMESRVADTLANISPAANETGLIAGQQDASAPIKNVIAGEIARGAGEARERTSALARLSGYGAAAQERASGNRLFDANMGLERLLSRGSLGVYAAEANRPSNYTPGDPTLGAILTGVGGLASQYAGRNWNVGGGGTLNKTAGPGTSMSMTTGAIT